MNKKQTLFAKKQAMRALRNERLDAGLCQECGANPRTVNLDNTKSVHCQPCKDAKQRAAWTALHGPGKRPVVKDEFDLVDDFGYLDTPRFYAYCETVKRVILRAAFPPSIGDMRRSLGLKFNDRMHADALDYLMADGCIRDKVAGSLTRYEPAIRHDRSTIEFGRRHITGSKGTRKPDNAVFEDRRVTA